MASGVKQEVDLTDVLQMLQSLRADIIASEQRVKAELLQEVQLVVQQSVNRADEVLNYVRAEAATHVELRTQQLAERQAQVEQGVAQALDQQQQHVAAIGTAAVGAAQAANVAATAAWQATRSIGGTSVAGGQIDTGDVGSVHVMTELLAWLKDPKHQPGARIPQLPEGVPYFDGRFPSKEGADAAGFLRSIEVYRALSPELNISEGMLILMTTSRFQVNGRAFNWWQKVLLEAESGVMPFTDYAGFKRVFLHEMRQPDEAISLRLDLENITLLNSRNFRDYVHRFQLKVAKLENLGAAMSKEDKLIRFSRGLSSHKELYRAVKLTARSLEEAVESVTDRYNQLCLRAQSEGKPNPDDEMRKLKPRKRQGGHLYAMSHAESEADEVDEDEQQQWDEDDEYEEDYDDELCAVQMRGVGRRGRGRGRGRGAPGGRGRGRGPRGGGAAKAGRGDRVGRRNLSPQQLEWFHAGKCVLCGNGGHFAADCKQPPAGQGNA